MIHVGDYGLCDRLCARVVGSSVGGRAWGAPEGTRRVRGPSENLTSGPFMSHRYRHEGEIHCQDPRAIPNRRWRGGAASVNVEFCGGGPRPSTSGFSQGSDPHIRSGEGGEGGGLQAGVINPCSNGYGRVGVPVRTTYAQAT